MDNNITEKIIEINNLEVKFDLRGKTLTAIRGISLDVYKGESIAIVGESGSGKSVFMKTFLGLLESNGYISNGEIIYNEKNLASFKSEKDWQTIRGKEIAMIFQDPMTALNPLITIGRQITESILLHRGLKGDDAKKLALDILVDVGINDPERRFNQYPFEFSGRYATKSCYCHRNRL